MSCVTVGVVDYGVGNHASVIHSLQDLGYKVRVSAQTKVLDATDILILPGVGAFPSAMQALHRLGLVQYLQQQSNDQRPIIGICLGMQLLASASHEIEYTPGLNIIPGEVVPLDNIKCHIGWNTLECKDAGSLFQRFDGESFYFNHSYCYKGASDYQTCMTHHTKKFVSVIHLGSVVGVQFHPEKSQAVGRVLLNHLISELTHA